MQRKHVIAVAGFATSVVLALGIGGAANGQALVLGG